MKPFRILCTAGLFSIATILSGCLVGPPSEVTLTPLSGRYGYHFEGALGLTGTITKNNLNDADWVLEGRFVFPSSGYTTFAPDITVMESYPEQVLVKFHVVSPPDGVVVLPVLTEVPVRATISASNMAQFRLQVIQYAASP